MGSFVLASASPRRQEMLRRLGLSFEVMIPHVDETPRVGESPEGFAVRLAHEKALTVYAKVPHACVIAADTVVVRDQTILGKPRDIEEARTMLISLSGRTHTVITAYRIVGPDLDVGRAVSTRVTMKQLRPLELEAYLASGDWRDKAGGYGIQEGAAHLVSEIEGSYTNVVGLPLCELVEDLLQRGIITEAELFGTQQDILDSGSSSLDGSGTVRSNP